MVSSVAILLLNMDILLFRLVRQNSKEPAGMGLFCYPWPGLLQNSGQGSHGNPTSTFLYQSYRSLQHLRA
jgi:hypothetical protein